MGEVQYKWTLGVVVVVLLVSVSVDWYMRNEYREMIQDLEEEQSKELEALRQEYGTQITTLNVMVENLRKELKEDLSIVTETVKQSREESSKEIEKLSGELKDIEVQAGVDFSAVVEDALKGVVAIVTDVAQGSGAIISEEGYVVTNYHVIRGASSLGIVMYDGDVFAGSLVGFDKVNDLAVLKMVNPPSVVEELNFADSDDVKIGEKVIALGNPVGLSFTVTEGIISQRDRQIRPGMVPLLQTDAQINPGNSGGPLLNKDGNIVGILVLKVQGYEGLGFAIPSNYVNPKVEELIGKEI